jgi:3-demethylubiquinone-9 3-methyltransferase
VWFDREAVEATEFYSSTFPNSRVTDVSILHRWCVILDMAIFFLARIERPSMGLSAGSHHQGLLGGD